MKKIVKPLMMVLFSLSVTACYYDETPVEDVIIPEDVSYIDDIQPIFNQSCIGCHKPGSVEPDLTVANSYNALINDGYVLPENASGSSLYQSLIGNGAPLMPPNGALNEGKIVLVEKWITQGALNN